jgi:signal transduction histidine kinase
MLAMTFAIFPLSSAFAQEEHGTKDEAVALVKKAIDYYKKNGADKTYAAINNQDPNFKIKDLYLFAAPLKPTSPLLAHGANVKMVGKDLSQLKDADGNYIARMISEVAQSKDGKGWIDYKWPNPISKQIEQKTTYIERVDDIYFACGVYK